VRIINAYPLDQSAQVRVDLRSASKRAGFPTPVPAEAGPMPADEGLGADDRNDLQDRRKPSIQLDQEQANATTHLPPQHDKLMSERGGLQQKFF
jgi:hypothetical protein